MFDRSRLLSLCFLCGRSCAVETTHPIDWRADAEAQGERGEGFDFDVQRKNETF
jgi:hypothetical protein